MKSINTLIIFLGCCYFSIAQVVENVQLPVPNFANVAFGSTPSDPAFYVWGEITNTVQGVNIFLSPTEIRDLFMQENNCRLAFNLLHSGSFIVSLDVNYDDEGWVNIYQGSSIQSVGWIDPPTSFLSEGEHNLKVRYLSATSGQFKNREYNVTVTPVADKFYRDNTQVLPSDTSTIFTTGNTLTLWDNPNEANAKPFLVVEGFDPGNGRFFHSLIHIGCTGADGLTDDDSIINSIWAKIKTRTVESVNSGEDTGENLTYYASYDCANITTANLLKNTDGQCGAWARFLIDILKTQGVSHATESNDYVLVAHPNWLPTLPGGMPNWGWTFFVKNWTKLQVIPLKDPPPIPHHSLLLVPVDQNPIDGTTLHNGTEYTFKDRYTDFIDDTGIEGQSNVNPASIFSNHQFCNIKGIKMDASYGIEHNLATIESDAIDGWGYQSRYIIDETHYNVDLNGNGVIDQGTVEITGIFVDPNNASSFALYKQFSDY